MAKQKVQTPAPKAKGKKSTQESRQVIYPEPVVQDCLGAEALTAERAKDILGWEEAPDAGSALLKDVEEKYIICTHNLTNRRFDQGWARKLAQDILNRNWRFNGEAIIIGKYGSVLSGQHRLIALVLAEQLRNSEKQRHHWAAKWPEPVSIECTIRYGIDETGETTRTLDNVKPRSLEDVLLTDPTKFPNAAPKDRAELCRMTNYAVKFLWRRTGRKDDPFSKFRTHSESLEFLDHHQKIYKAIRHIWEEDQPDKVEGVMGPKKIGQYLSRGTAAGLLYLMGASASDGDAYRNMDTPSEKKLKWDHWDKASDFFTLLASRAEEVAAVARRIGELRDPNTGVGGTPDEQVAILCLAWNAYLQNGRVDTEDLQLEYAEAGDVKILVTYPDVGGIDLGDEEAKADAEAAIKYARGEAEAPTEEPTASNEDPEREEARRQMAERIAAELQARRGGRRAPGEVPSPEPTVTDAEGKPPVPPLKKTPPKPKRKGRAEVEAEQTARAAAHDAEDAALATAEAGGSENGEMASEEAE